MDKRSDLPSVDRIMQGEQAASLSGSYGRPLTLRAIRKALETYRGRLSSQAGGEAPALDEILSETEHLLQEWTRLSLRPVINATGVILHTNLGRAPISRKATAAMGAIALGYSSLELDLSTGKRGARSLDAEAALRRLTGAEAALVVNNNAAAVLLILTALASRKRVAVARSQLVEIGGGFRMPDVMRQSGAKLVEVGTTNKVRLSDYEEVLPEVEIVLRAHRSNFAIVGFTEEPSLAAVVQAAHGAGRIVVDDLGSGSLLDTTIYGLAHEPTVQESLEAGADMVCFSGDKLLGGPQAGLIVGRAALVDKLRRHPLTRALRADKIILAGTSATLAHYLRNEAETEIPVWRMLATPAQQIRKRAESWGRLLGQGVVQESHSTLGGGSLPGEMLASHVLALKAASADQLANRLREQTPAIIARREKGLVLMDPRTVQPEEDDLLVAGVRAALKETR